MEARGFDPDRRKDDMHLKNKAHRLNNGFTLVEMLLVIGILGILSASLLSSFSYVKTAARQSQAQSLVSEVATAFTMYLQKEREWDTDIINKTEMDEDVCRFFQDQKLLDLTTYKLDASGKLSGTKNDRSLDRFGMLDPWGRGALKKNDTQSAKDPVDSRSSFQDHRIQFRLDKDYDGFVDGNEGSPKNVKVRASVLVWTRGPDGIDDFEKGGRRYPYDDRLSWPHAQFETEN